MRLRATCFRSTRSTRLIATADVPPVPAPLLYIWPPGSSENVP
jgi:hypothetical protein